MKDKLHKLFGESWRTTLLGVFCILLGIRSAFVVWVPTQTIRFNLLYVLPAQISLVVVGWALLHARDQAAHDKSKRDEEDKP